MRRNGNINCIMQDEKISVFSAGCFWMSARATRKSKHAERCKFMPWHCEFNLHVDRTERGSVNQVIRNRFPSGFTV